MSDNIAIKDMISAALDGQPVAFKDHFNAAIMDRVYNAVEAKRVEVATNLFKASDESEEAPADAETVIQGEEDAQDA